MTLIIIAIISGIGALLVGSYSLWNWILNLVHDTRTISYSAGLYEGFGVGHNVASQGIDRKRVREVNGGLQILPECCLDLSLIPKPECDTCQFLEICKEW